MSSQSDKLIAKCVIEFELPATTFVPTQNTLSEVFVPLTFYQWVDEVAATVITSVRVVDGVTTLHVAE